MKKLTVLFLSIAMLLSLFTGCSKEGNPTETATQPKEHTLMVGFGRADFTPVGSMPIGDPYFGGYKMSTEVKNPLFATCVAFSDETGNTVLLFHMDLGSIRDAQLIARGSISKKLGVPANQIMITATHTHATPRVTEDHEGVMDWSNSIKDRMYEAAKQAMEDRKPAKMYTTSIECPNMNFIRHYIMSDGSYAGDNFGSTAGKTYVSHTEDPDKTLQLIKFTREGGKDVILANWQGHPHRLHGGSGTTIGSDIVGAMRDAVEKDLNCNFAYFSGASGNINNKGRIPGETITNDYLEHGQALAAYAVQASQDFTERAIGKVQIVENILNATAKDGNNKIEIRLYAISLGDVAFVTAPIEMFNSQGMEIKASSPFECTFVCTYANGHLGYVPDLKTFNTYVSYEETQTKFAKGTAEEITKNLLTMLNDIYKTK